MMTVSISSLTFNTIIGILESERTTPQKVVIDCVLTYDYTKANEFLDYAKIAHFLENCVKEQQYYLLEEAVIDLLKQLKSKFPLIQTLAITFSKPDILGNAQASVSLTKSYL